MIFDAHLLSEGMGESANALLKILEEPPENTTLILVTDSKNALLPTVISRCQNIHFPNLRKDCVKSILIEKGFDDQQATEITFIARGDIHLAIDLAGLYLIGSKSMPVIRNLWSNSHMSELFVHKTFIYISI